MDLAYITHPNCLLHDMGHGLPEIPARLSVIEETLKSTDLYNQLKKYDAPKATKNHLQLAHHPEYIDYIYLIAPKKDAIALEPDTWMNAHSLDAALFAVGALIKAVDLVLKGEVRAAFCNIRPPGHHAEKATAMGFCIFNNVAIAAAYALKQYHVKKVAIIDFDVHHGNGTEDIFKHDDRVLYCSSFEHPFYPYSGATTKSEHIINIPLSAGTDGTIFREKIEKMWFPKLLAFKPELIFISAGFDANEKDVMSNLLLKEEDYAWITREIKKIALQVCEGRIISALEGGYSLETLGSCVAQHIREL